MMSEAVHKRFCHCRNIMPAALSLASALLLKISKALWFFCLLSSGFIKKSLM